MSRQAPTVESDCARHDPHQELALHGAAPAGRGCDSGSWLRQRLPFCSSKNTKFVVKNRMRKEFG